MRKLQKILLGTFLGGVLLGGIGTGVAFVEYSSITYAGEKKIGQSSVVTEDLDFSFDPGKGIVVVAPVWYDEGKISYVETDKTVPENVVRYRVTYNEKTVIPGLHFSEYDEEESQTEEPSEQEDRLAEENMGPGFDDTDISDEGEGQIGPDALENQNKDDGGRSNVIDTSKKKTVRLQGEIRLSPNYRDDFGLWMENKDEILRDLKQGRIASYRADHITDVKILVNPASADLIKQVKEY